MSLVEQLMQDDLDQGQSTLEGVKASRQDYVGMSAEMLDLLDSFYPGHNLSGESAYDDGVEELRQAMDVFNNQQREKRNSIADYLYDMNMRNQTYLEARIIQLQREIDEQYISLSERSQIFADHQLATIQAENHEIIAREMEKRKYLLQDYVDQQMVLRLFELKEFYEMEANQQLEQILAELGYPATPSDAVLSEDEATPSDATPSEATESNAYRINLATPSDAGINLSLAGGEEISLFEKIFPLKRVIDQWQKYRT